MEGYSVTEAASVLGVPTERVWELLARGVLSGAPEGETGMRVYLQPRPAPAPPEARRTNGNGGAPEPERELSPFRELLTEFRNLTERYGQALLALGEARGEVAALRSRVDTLEARIDLRLPAGSAPVAGWSSSPMPFPTERAVMPTVPSEEPGAPEPHEDEEEEEERPARRRGPRRATESFAEALARAEDPSIPELPGGAEAAAALAALHAQPDDADRAMAEAADASLPRDLPAAEAVPVAEEADALAVATEPASMPVEAGLQGVIDAGAEEQPEVVEPDSVVAAEPEVVELESVTAEPEVVEPEFVAAEPQVAAELEVVEPEFVAAEPEVAAELEPVQAERERESAEPIEEEPEVAAREVVEVPDEQPEPAADAVATEPLEWDAERYTTAVEEPDWYAAEAFDAQEPVPTPISDAPAAPVEREREPERSESAAPESAGEEPETPQRLAPEDTMLWYGGAYDEASGASEMEVATSGGRPVGHADSEALPGSHELDDAMVALDALARPVDAPAGDQPEHGAAEREDPSKTQPSIGREETEPDEWPPHSRSTIEPIRRPERVAPPNVMPRSGTTATGPASRAYRRLRRIFPG